MFNHVMTLRQDYWENLEVKETDIEFLTNYLFEIEKPLPVDELVLVLIKEQIHQIGLSIEKQNEQDVRIYQPKNQYKVGETLVFPQLAWQKGRVVNIRNGFNPDVDPFEVIQVLFEGDLERNFAASYKNHVLNKEVSLPSENPLLDHQFVLNTFSEQISSKLVKILAEESDLVCVAEKWFPRALLVDINIGHLNLAEALLDMKGGGPLSTGEILKQIDLAHDVNTELIEFSLNSAMHEDKDERFDEVGPSGEISWFLHRLEPDWVQNIPIYLQYKPYTYDTNQISSLEKMLDIQLVDELEPPFSLPAVDDSATISLIYPHWRAGSLPLAKRIAHIFPSAIESPRVRFTFIDANKGERFSGWVVRPSAYICGLKDWYTSNGVIPGSLITVERGKGRGEVVIRIAKRRSTRDWIRTALVGADGGVVFAMLKQLVLTNVDERMAIYVPDVNALDLQWKKTRHDNLTLQKTIMNMMRELIKLNPQGHLHFNELYSGVNLKHRCPPGVILAILMEKPWATHLGDLYFHFNREYLEE